MAFRRLKNSAAENARMAALRKLRILDTAPEPLFDSLVDLTARAHGVPIALISFIDQDRQWFKARVGLDICETPRDLAFCYHAIRSDQILIVPDAAADPRFRDNPLVTGAPGIRFYAGAPLVTPEGHALGTLCIIDTKPRDFPQEEADRLSRYAVAVMQGLLLRLGAEESQEFAKTAERKSAFLALAGEVAQIGVWSWDAATEETIWSPELYAIHGIDPDSEPVIGDEALRVFHPDDAAKLRILMDGLFSKAGGFELEVRLASPQPSSRRVDVRAVSRFNEDGSLAGALGTVQDVTYIHLADEALQRSEDRYRALALRANDLVIRLKFDGEVKWVSPSCERILGYQPDELVGTRVVDHVEPEDWPEVNRTFAKILSQGPTAPAQVLEYRCRRKNGDWVWLETNPAVVYNEQTGEPIEWIDVGRDITARKAAEAELMSARDAAEIAVQTKSDFLANMSHELRTPLTAIIGFAELLTESETLEATERRYAHRISTASGALLSVINDVLDYSKLEAGAMELDPQPFDLRELVASTIDLIAGGAERKGVALGFELQGADVVLHGDAPRIRQVLLNLLSNALKFTERGEVRVEVAVTPGLEGETQVHCAVRDTGMGIPPERIAQLFERFVQADDSITRRFGGTGLGLAISHRLIEAMGGEMGVESEVGAGSTFWFRLALPTVLEPESEVGTGASDLNGLRVLIVDDVAPTRVLLQQMLTAWGAQSESVADGVAAVQAVKDQDWDVVLMDIHMPVLDGLAATRLIRQLPGGGATIRIVALTAATSAERVAACMEAGMDAHLGKPIDAAALYLALASAQATKLAA